MFQIPTITQPSGLTLLFVEDDAFSREMVSLRLGELFKHLVVAADGITGNIKSIEDSIQIKEAISHLLARGSHSVLLKIQDSFSMTSTVIGYLMKLVNHDKVQVVCVIGDKRLFELIEELNLVQTFNARLASV